MTGDARAATFVTGAAGFMGTALLRVFPRAAAISPMDGREKRTMKRFGPALLLALPFVVVLAPHAADPTRTIDITLSRHAFSPQRIEVLLGEPVRLNLVSADGTHGFQVRK